MLLSSFLHVSIWTRDLVAQDNPVSESDLYFDAKLVSYQGGTLVVEDATGARKNVDIGGKATNIQTAADKGFTIILPTEQCFIKKKGKPFESLAEAPQTNMRFFLERQKEFPAVFKVVGVHGPNQIPNPRPEPLPVLPPPKPPVKRPPVKRP